MVKLFTVGGILIDNVVAADGQVGPQTMGGNAVYSAAGARLWTDGVGVVGRIPSNYPAGFLRRLADAGVDISGVVKVEEDVTQAEWFFYNPDGSRTDHLHADFSCGPEYTPGTYLSLSERLALKERLRENDSVTTTFSAFRRRNPVQSGDIPDAYLGAQGAHLAANRPDCQKQMAEFLTARGLRVTCDPGSNAMLLLEQGLEKILASTTAFLPSEKELSAFAPDLGAHDGLRHLRALGGLLPVVKLGAQGSAILSPDDEVWSIPALQANAQDPTGAGDAFCGGFLAGIALLNDPLAAICMATVSASFAVEAFGPFHLLETDRDNALARVHKLSNELHPALKQRMEPTLRRLEEI